MPTYLIHGFRWPRPLIRIHIILQNLDDAAAEWLIAPATTETMLENFTELWPQTMANLPNLRFVEQFDPTDESPAACSQPYAYIADICEQVKLGIEVDEVRGKGLGDEQWNAIMELRDKLAPDEKVGWFVVVCGDEDRTDVGPEEEEEEEAYATNATVPVELPVRGTAHTRPVSSKEGVPNGGATPETTYTNYSDTTSSRRSRQSRNSSERTPTVTTAPTASPSLESPREKKGLRKMFSMVRQKTNHALRLRNTLLMAPASTLVNKLKVQLKLSISRLRMVQQKDTAIAKQQRRAMAQLLEQGKDESARIRVENIIRSDLTTELLEILELYCELLLARAGLLEAKECDAGLEEAVKSIIYAAPRTDVKELHNVRALLAEKFGKEFVLDATENKDDKVAKRVLDRLRVEPPKPELVEAYLSTIADAYNIDWPKGRLAAREAAANQGDDEDDDDNPSGGQKVPALEAPEGTEPLVAATPPRNLGPKSPVSVVPPSPSTDNVSPRIKLPGPPDLKPSAKMVKANKPDTTGPGGKIPDVNELAARFAQLKR
ncbi:DUF292-domain-containing protein, partial [Aureobasidium melanogenum]